MMVHVSPKKVNNVSELKISATFQHQGCKYEERYKTKGHFLNALKRKKDTFINAVDYNSMEVITRDTLGGYRNA